MNKIQLLPEHIVDQIKAGEVIERPASLIKELLENSVDAGSTHISITVNNNGLDLISIEDDGGGITFNDLPFAFCRHATSKISSFEDLSRLLTYGFRGEALASIASIAKVSCSSSTREGDGGKIVINGGNQLEHSPNKSTDHGTSFYITDLFYNTPPRLKFLKSQTSERNAIRKVLNSFLLSCPKITWSFKFDDNDRDIFEACRSKEERIKHIFKIKSDIATTTHEYDQHQIIAYTSIESGMSSSGKAQYLLVNDRLISDQQIHRTIIRNLSSYWRGGIGHYYIDLKIPPHDLDVNVHPNKTTVKFHQPSIVFSLISSALKKMIFTQEIPASKGFHPDLLNNGSDFKGLQPSLDFDTAEQIQSVASIIHLMDDYVLLKNCDMPPMLIKGSTLFTFYFSFKINSLLPLSDSEITPLLISEPIQLESGDEHFALLGELGFELDRLDSSTIVLRSIPSFALEFTKYLISSLKNIRSFIPKDGISSIFIDDHLLGDHIIEMILDEVPISSLIDQKIVTVLKRTKLDRLIYE